MIVFDTWRNSEIITNTQVSGDTDRKDDGPFKHSHAASAGGPITLTLGTVTSLLYQYHCKKHPKIRNST